MCGQGLKWSFFIVKMFVNVLLLPLLEHYKCHQQKCDI